jgi:hypothetical protein
MSEEIENKIKKEWVAKALGSANLSVDDNISSELMDDETVMLINSTNMFGDPVYVYLKVQMNNFRPLRDAMVSGDSFMPSDFGEVLAAGRGSPPQAVIDEMRVRFKMVDLPKPATPKNAAPMGFSQPKFFDDEN